VTGTLVTAVALALTPLGVGADASVGFTGRAGAPQPHDLHVSYGSSVVEENVVVVRIRFFADDLAAALGGFAGLPDFVMTENAEVDALFLRYFADRFSLEIGGRGLPAGLVGSGQDMLDREPVWWYAVQFQAEAPVTAFTVRNELLLELFDDQSNIVKFVHFPDERQRTYSFGAGEEVFEVVF
jgi:hypothetical protein